MNTIEVLRRCLGLRLGPAQASALHVVYTDARVAIRCRELRFDARSGGTSNVRRVGFGVSASDDAAGSIAAYDSDDAALEAASTVDVLLGPVDRIGLMAPRGSDVACGVLLEAEERPMVTERTSAGVVSRKGAPRRVRLCIAVEGSIECALWISRDDSLIDELIASCDLVVRDLAPG